MCERFYFTPSGGAGDVIVVSKEDLGRENRAFGFLWEFHSGRREEFRWWLVVMMAQQ